MYKRQTEKREKRRHADVRAGVENSVVIAMWPAVPTAVYRALLGSPVVRASSAPGYPFTGICIPSLVSAFFGSLIERTPSFIVASILSASTVTGRETLRRNLPSQVSLR